MSLISKYTIVLFLLLVFDNTYGQEKNRCSSMPLNSQDEVAFQEGEILTYIIHYKWLGIRTDVGDATISLYKTTHNGRSAFHANAKGGTYGFWDSFFKVRDHYEASFYQDNLRPFYFHRDIREGGYKMKNTYYWNDYTNNINVNVERMDNMPKDTLLSGGECTFDILSLFYYARNINFEEVVQGVNNPISFVIDEEIFNIYFRYMGKEVKKIPKLGRYNTLKFAAKVVAGEVFKGDQEMIIWVSDDKNKVPLLFQSPIIVGSVYGRLGGYKKLKYPLYEAD